MKKEFKYDFIKHLMYFFAIIIIVFFISRIPSIKIWIDKYNSSITDDISLDNLLTAQISVTFLTTSLLSILSIKDKIIYGVDIIQYKLEFPKHTNFVSLWSYLIVLLSSSILFFFIKENILFICFFLISLLVLIYLLLKILETFFNHENLKKEISRKIIDAIRENSATLYLSNLFEHTLKIVITGNSVEIKDNLLLYINILSQYTKNDCVLEKLKYQFAILSNKLSENHPSIFFSFKDIYTNNNQTNLYKRLSSNIIIESIIHNDSIELRTFLMYDLIKMEIEHIAPLFGEKLLEYSKKGFLSNQDIMSKVSHLGEYEYAKSYMKEIRHVEFLKSIEETENYFKGISDLYSSWISAACSVNNYDAIAEIYLQFRKSEKRLYSLLDYNLKIIAWETGFYLRAINFFTLNYLKHVFLNGIIEHKIPDNIIVDFINFVALITPYETKDKERAAFDFKNKEALVKLFFDSHKQLLIDNGYQVEVLDCINSFSN